MVPVNMTTERYRKIFGNKVVLLTDKQVAEQIAQDRQLIQSFMRLVVENKLTIPPEKGHYGN